MLIVYTCAFSVALTEFSQSRFSPTLQMLQLPNFLHICDSATESNKSMERNSFFKYCVNLPKSRLLLVTTNLGLHGSSMSCKRLRVCNFELGYFFSTILYACVEWRVCVFGEIRPQSTDITLSLLPLDRRCIFCDGKTLRTCLVWG